MARPDSFFALGVRPPLVAALERRGIVEPFAIQAAALPDALAGRDVLGKGRTGSGKTVAFALPLLERVLEASGRGRPRHPRGLVLVPTRELAVQVAETIDALAQAVGLTSMTVYGGVRPEAQTRRLDRGVDVVVATPGRLEDLLEQGALSLDDIQVVVLDEADMMADMGFLQPVTRLLDACPAGQRMLFSATLDDEVGRLVKRFLNDPLVHEVSGDDDAVEADHYLFLVRHDNKFLVLSELVRGGGRTLAFARTKHGAERIARQLSAAGIPAIDLHGNLHQGARQRNLAKFADGRVDVLVATDIAARGIHVDDIGLVIHVDPPAEHKAFLHRSGRTARAGHGGTVVTLATKNQNAAVRSLMAKAKITPTQLVVKPGDEIIAQLRAPEVGASTGGAIFLPDPDDLYDDDRDADRERPRPERPRPERQDRPERTKQPRQGRTRPERTERPRAERPRPERREEPARRSTPQRRDDERPAAQRRPSAGGRGSGAAAFTREWWGPEPWELDDEAFDAIAGRDRRRGRRADAPPAADGRGYRRDTDARPARDGQRNDRRDSGRGRDERGAVERDPWARGVKDDRAPRRRGGDDRRTDRRTEAASERGPREDRRPRPGREQRREQRETERTSPGAAAKGRWSDEDRAKARASASQGFGFTKGKSKAKKKSHDKDKGKPKRFTRGS